MFCSALEMMVVLDFIILIILMASFAKVHCATESLETRNIQHILKVQRFTCKQPQPRLFLVEDLFHVSSKDLYTPRATVLHRCGEDTGCCPSEDMSCVSRKEDTVTLIFSVYDTQYKNSSKREMQATNHTVCWCTKSD